MKDTSSASPPLHFVLVHGYQSGGWCWYKICSLIKDSGYKFSCPDLKSAGIDPTDPESIHLFDEYNRPLIDLLSALPANEKVILVGHSAGGVSVTHASHLFPEKIQLAIYVAATMLRLGFQTDEDVKDGVPEEGGNKGDKVGVDAESPKSIIPKGEFEHNILYHMISQEDLILASLLTKQKGAKEAIKNAKFTESEGIDKVKRVYIKTMYDQTLKPRQQDAMIKRWPPSNVLTIESDHSPIVSAPKELFGLIVKASLLNM